MENKDVSVVFEVVAREEKRVDWGFLPKSEGPMLWIEFKRKENLFDVYSHDYSGGVHTFVKPGDLFWHGKGAGTEFFRFVEEGGRYYLEQLRIKQVTSGNLV